jgi:hypothetical protein
MLEGTGFFIWQVVRCEGGDAQQISQAARAAGFRWVAVKVADGAMPSNQDPHNRARSLLPPLVAAFRAVGIQAWGWHYLYGANWSGEAVTAKAQIEALHLDGYILDAEGEFKLPGRGAAAGKFMAQMRAQFPRLPMGLCSYRFPSLHPEFPWDAFLGGVDLNLPQVYWEDAHDPAAELTRSAAEFAARPLRKPLVPIGPTYKRGGWAPTAADIQEFQRAAAQLNLGGVGYFSWDECRQDLPEVWSAIQGPRRRMYFPIVETDGPPGEQGRPRGQGETG